MFHCADCEKSAQLAREQHDRFFVARPINAITFLNRPEEEAASAEQIKLNRRCLARKKTEGIIPVR